MSKGLNFCNPIRVYGDVSIWMQYFRIIFHQSKTNHYSILDKQYFQDFDSMKFPHCCALDFHPFQYFDQVHTSTLVHLCVRPHSACLSKIRVILSGASGWLECLEKIGLKWRYIHITIYHKNYIISEVKNIRMIFFPEFHEFRLYDVQNKSY